MAVNYLEPLRRDALVAEALELRWGTLAAIDLELEDVIFEVDSATMVTTL